MPERVGAMLDVAIPVGAMLSDEPADEGGELPLTEGVLLEVPTCEGFVLVSTECDGIPLGAIEFVVGNNVPVGMLLDAELDGERLKKDGFRKETGEKLLADAVGVPDDTDLVG